MTREETIEKIKTFARDINVPTTDCIIRGRKIMTRKDAIITLDILWSNTLLNEAHKDAITMGIQAIKTLAQEPCNDAISRDAIKDILGDVLHTQYGDMFDFEDVWEELMGRIDDLPPVTPTRPQTDWIPVSERLPEEKTNPATLNYCQYLCTVKHGDEYDVKYYTFVGGHWWNGPGIMDKYVIAWMPLPEPYKENEK